MLAFVLLIAAVGCKQESTRLETDYFAVDMPSEPEYNYTEWPLDPWDTTLPIDNYDVDLGENEGFVVSRFDWADMLRKVQADQIEQGNSGELEDMYEGFAQVLFATMVNTGKAAGNEEQTLINNYPAYIYPITSFTDMVTGEVIMDGTGKGHLVVIPTEQALYTMVYYASDDKYDEEKEQALFNSFEIIE